MSVGDGAEVGVRRNQSRRGIPEYGLPVWETLPLWAKLPVPPAPKDAFVLTTTNLCEKIRSPTKDDQFDLNDPERQQFSNEYQSLHDPHLKYHLGTPLMRYRLIRGGFITNEGKVLCTLREYNEYRKFLRQQEWQTQVLETRKRDHMQRDEIHKRKQQHIGCFGLNLNRSQKVKEVRKRLQQRYEQDKERYSRIVEEDEVRREKIRLGRLARLNEQERKRQEDEMKRRTMLQKKDEEERRKKLMVYAKWTKDDQMRRARMEERRRRKEYEHRKKLETMWEERKKQQSLALRAEEVKRLHESERRTQRVKEYTAYMDTLQKRREERLAKMQESARLDKLQRQEAYANKLQKTLKVQRTRKRAERMRSKRAESRLQSNWDWTISLKQALDKAASDGDLQIKTGAEDIELERKYSASELGLFDLRGAHFDDHVIDEREDQPEPHRHVKSTSQHRLSQLDLGDLRGANLKKRLYGRLHHDPKAAANMEKLLQYICDKYSGADMERIKQAIVDHALEDKPSRTNVINLDAGMFPEQGKVPDELAEAMSCGSYVSITEDFVEPKMSGSDADMAVRSPLNSEDDFQGRRQRIYSSPPLSRRHVETMSEVLDKVADGTYHDIDEVARFIVGWAVNIAANVVYPATRLDESSESDVTLPDAEPSFLSACFTPGRPGSSSQDSSQASFEAERPSPYKDMALHMSLLGIGDRNSGDQRMSEKGIGQPNQEFSLRPPGVSDHGPISRVDLRDSVTLTRSRLRPGPSFTGAGLNSLEDLIGTLTETLGDIRAGRVDADRMNVLRQLAGGILESAAVLADGVESFVDEQERLLARRSSLLIEALISDTLDQVMEDVKQNILVTRTSSNLIADLVSYTLNEALDDTRNINSEKLARIDAILVDKFITNNLHDALAACREGRPTAEAMLLRNFIDGVVNKAVDDLSLPGSTVDVNAPSLAASIVQTVETLSEQGSTPTPPTPSVSDTAYVYVTSVLDHVIKSLREGKISQKEAREMAQKMRALGEGGIELSDEDIGMFVEATLVKVLDDMDADTADKVVTTILSDAAFIASEIGDNYLVKQLMAGLESGRSTAVSAILMSRETSPVDENGELQPTQSTPDILEGLVRLRPGSSRLNRFVRNVLSDVVINNFIESVLSGHETDKNIGAYSKPSPSTESLLTNTSISETVVNTFVKKLLNSALEGLSPTKRESVEVSEFVSSIIERSHDFGLGAPSPTRIEQMADEIAEHLSSLSLSKKNSNNISTKVTDSCPAVYTPEITPETKATDLSHSQHQLMQGAESLHQHTHLSDTDESSEDETPEDYQELHPTFHGEEVHIEQSHAPATLGAISVKHYLPGSHLMHNDAIPRNSFSNLTRPDVSVLKILQNKSIDQVKDKLEHVYLRSQLAIAQHHEDELETLSDDEDENNKPTDLESVESEAEFVVSVTELDAAAKQNEPTSLPGIELEEKVGVQQRGASYPAMKTEQKKAVTKSGSVTKKVSKEKSSPLKSAKSESKERVKSSESKDGGSKERVKSSESKNKSGSKERVKSSESKKQTAKAYSSGKIASGKKSSTDKKVGRTSSTGPSASPSASRSKSPTKLVRRSKQELSSKKSSSRQLSNVTRSSSDVTEPRVVKSIRSVDGTFSSKVEIRSTKSGSNENQNVEPNTVSSRGIIMENEVAEGDNDYM